MLGYNGNSVVITSNMFTLIGSSFRNEVIVIPKADLLSGTPNFSNAVKYQDLTAIGSTPQPAVDMNNGTALLPIISQSGALLRSNAGLTGGGAATLSPGNTNYIVGSIIAPPTADQPGTKANIHTGDTRMQSALSLVNGEIWGVISVGSSSRTAIRWYRLNAATSAVIEEGTITDPSLNLMRPSIAVNGLGDVVIGFSATSPSVNVSTYFVAGQTAGGTTSFGALTQTHAGVSDYQRLDSSSRNRWGDYSATSLDPADPGIFWTIQEFVSATDEWREQVTEIILPHAGESRWANAASGSFSLGGNWLGGNAPNGSSHVIFSRSVNPGGSNLVMLASDETVDKLSVRQGAITLQLDGHTMTADSAIINEFNGHPTLTVTGGTLATPQLLRIDAGGTLRLGAAANLSAGTILLDGGKLIANTGGGSVLRAESINIINGAVIDLRDNRMLVDYSSVSPITSIRQLIGSGLQTGEGIVGLTSDPGMRLGYGENSLFGQASIGPFTLDATSIIIDYVFAGDSNCDGQVNLLDLASLAHYWQSSADWTGGDFNYDGFVNIADLRLLAGNWLAGAPLGSDLPLGAALSGLGLPTTNVPEPAACLAISIAALLTGRRRRN
jgi:hypothetical protein